MYEKYLILRAELHHPVKSFNEKLYILETWHKHLNENEISCRRFSNKMALYPIPDELKILKKLEKLLISERILFKKIAIIHGKGEFSKVMGSILQHSNRNCKYILQHFNKTGSFQWMSCC